MTTQKPLPLDDLDLVLEHTQEIWRELRGTRIFVTGGTGFIGTWLLESLLHANRQLDTRIRIDLLSRDSEAYSKRLPHVASSKEVSLWQGDVRTFEGPTANFDVVIHAATDVGNIQKAADYLSVFDVNTLGTRRVLEFAKDRNAQRLLLLSSGAVYGVQPPELTHIPESHEHSPSSTQLKSAYGIGKYASEWLASAYSQQYSLEAKIARIFTLVGPGLPLDGPFAAGNFIQNVLEEKCIKVQGDGTPMRSYLYAADMAIWLLHILCRGKTAFPYNVGSEHALSIKELAVEVAKLSQSEIDIHIAKNAAPDVLPARYVPCTTRIKNELGLTEITPISLALEKTLRWNAS